MSFMVTRSVIEIDGNVVLFYIGSISSVEVSCSYEFPEINIILTCQDTYVFELMNSKI